MNRFFVDGSIAGAVQIKSGDVRHIKNVLRLKIGDQIIAIDNTGKSAVCRITALDDGVGVAVEELLQADNEPLLEVILGQGIGKGDKMDFVVQKAVELGVKEIVPLKLERCVPSYTNDKAKSKSERWQKIAAEAAKQARRDIIPKVHEVMDLSSALARFSADTKIVFYEEESRQSLRCVLAGQKQAKRVFLLVGPEGGLTEQEVGLCRQEGFTSASLGKRILRTETAAVAGLAVVMYELGDFGDA